MNGKNVLQALEFQNNRVFNNQIDSITAIQVNIFILHRERYLPLEVDSAQMGFMAQAFLIGRFQQPRTEVPMHLDG